MPNPDPPLDIAFLSAFVREAYWMRRSKDWKERLLFRLAKAHLDTLKQQPIRSTCQGRFQRGSLGLSIARSGPRPLRALCHRPRWSEPEAEKENIMSDEHNGDTAVSNRKPSLIAYHVQEGKDDQSYWNRVGAAWMNRDGGYTVQLHAIPLDGRIVLTKPKSN